MRIMHLLARDMRSALCYRNAPPDRIVPHQRDIPAGARLCGLCFRRLHNLRITARVLFTNRNAP